MSALFLHDTNRFNTQPPEGGCAPKDKTMYAIAGFNTQPPEGGCQALDDRFARLLAVSTHSHPKVAARKLYLHDSSLVVSTHSHPKVAA